MPKKQSSPSLLFPLTVCAVLSPFLIILGIKLFNRENPEWLEPKATESEATPEVKPTYLPLEIPFNLSLYNGRIKVSFDLGFSARLPNADLLALAVKVDKKKDVIIANMNSFVLDKYEYIKTSQGLAQKLQTELPSVLRDIINHALATKEIPAPLNEVFITRLQISPG